MEINKVLFSTKKVVNSILKYREKHIKQRFEDLKKKRIKEYEAGEQLTTSGPSVLKFVIGYNCNYRCIFCNQSTIENKYGKNAITSNFKKLKNKKLLSGLQELYIQGGEPLVYKDTFKYIKYFRKINRKSSIIIVTNGYFLDSERRNELLSSDVRLIVSLDAGEKETYEKIRIGGKWERVLENIQLYKKGLLEKDSKGSVKTTFGVMATNYREIPIYYRKLKNIGLSDSEINFSIYNNFEGCLIPIRDALTYENAKKVYEYIENSCSQIQTDSFIRVKSILAWHINAYCNEDYRTKSERSFKKCATPWSGFLVNADGRINLSCCKTRYVENINNVDSLVELWNSDQVQEIRKAVDLQTYTDYCNPQCIPLYFQKSTDSDLKKVEHWRA